MIAIMRALGRSAAFFMLLCGLSACSTVNEPFAKICPAYKPGLQILQRSNSKTFSDDLAAIKTDGEKIGNAKTDADRNAAQYEFDADNQKLAADFDGFKSGLTNKLSKPLDKLEADEKKLRDATTDPDRKKAQDDFDSDLAQLRKDAAEEAETRWGSLGRDPRELTQSRSDSGGDKTDEDNDPLCLQPYVDAARAVPFKTADKGDKEDGGTNGGGHGNGDPAAKTTITIETTVGNSPTGTTAGSNGGSSARKQKSPGGANAGGQNQQDASDASGDAVDIQTEQQAYLYAMYEQSAAYCLYRRNKAHIWYRIGLSSYDFGDILLAAVVPVLTFSKGASTDTIGFISLLIPLFGQQFKDAVVGTSPGDDFGSTLAAMKTWYLMFAQDPAIKKPEAKLNFYDPALVYRLFKVTMEQTCTSDLKFSGSDSGSGAASSAGGNKKN